MRLQKLKMIVIWWKNENGVWNLAIWWDPESQSSQFAPQLLQLGEKRTDIHVRYLNKG